MRTYMYCNMPTATSPTSRVEFTAPPTCLEWKCPTPYLPTPAIGHGTARLATLARPPRRRATSS